MFRAVFTRRILGAIAFAIVFGIACFLLGEWQLSRYEAKDARASAVEANYGAPAVPLAEVLPSPSSALPEHKAWSKVTATGRYAGEHSYLVRGRTLSSSVGIEVLVPLVVQTPSGPATLMVDRGWVRLSDSAATIPDYPGAPTGEITVSGWLKPGEDDRGRDLPKGQLASVDLETVRAELGGAVYAAYLVLDHETTPSGSTPLRPTPLEAPSVDRGPHFAYALQWWLTALLGVAFVVYLYRSRPGAAAARETKASDGRQTDKAKKVRIWDEEDG